jgi:hypothetical protein
MILWASIARKPRPPEQETSSTALGVEQETSESARGAVLVSARAREPGRGPIQPVRRFHRYRAAGLHAFRGAKRGDRVRRDGHKVRLAAGVALGMDSGFGLLPGPARLGPGQSAQIVIHTTTLCGKALAGQAEDFTVLDVGIAHSGEVQVDFPHRRPYDAICGIGVSTFGTPKRGC